MNRFQTHGYGGGFMVLRKIRNLALTRQVLMMERAAKILTNFSMQTPQGTYWSIPPATTDYPDPVLPQTIT